MTPSLPYELRSTSELIITADVCEILGVDRSTISRWVLVGKIKPVRKIRMGRNGAFLFRRSEVEALKRELQP